MGALSALADYWIDSTVFIEGKKGPYGFDIAPRFWSLVDELIDAEQVASPVLVFDELMDVQDDLSNWAKARKTSGFWVQPSVGVQTALRSVVAYVNANYPPNHVTSRFLDRADPWVIAHALAEGGAVVTLEARVPANSQKVKIPNVCDHFNVQSVTTYQMLRDLGVSWTI